VKYIIGLTGNIATGKGAVSGMLDCLGAEAIDADVLVHELMEKGTPIWQAVVQEFGEDILGHERDIDRKKLEASFSPTKPLCIAWRPSCIQPSSLAPRN